MISDALSLHYQWPYTKALRWLKSHLVWAPEGDYPAQGVGSQCLTMYVRRQVPVRWKMERDEGINEKLKTGDSRITACLSPVLFLRVDDCVGYLMTSARSMASFRATAWAVLPAASLFCSCLSACSTSGRLLLFKWLMSVLTYWVCRVLR